MILFVTQYYRGLGHSMRIKHIIQECSKLIDCGIVHQLMQPPIKFDVSKEYTLMTEDRMDYSLDNPFKSIVTPQNIQHRINYWKQILDENPQIKVCVFEGFPFCRHQFAYELFSFIEEAKKRNIKLVCSIRDFPWDEPHEMGLQDWVAKTQNIIIRDYFEKVLVHGDDKVLPLLPDTLDHYNPRTLYRELEPYIEYTGYVVNPNQNKHSRENNYVFVSCGLNKEESIDVFLRIMKKAHLFPELEFIFPVANKYSKLSNSRQSKGNVHLVDYIPNLYTQLEKCALFITYGGYNSTMEVINSGCPAIIIPRSNGRKLEQFVRCHTLTPYNLFKVCDPNNINRIENYITEILEDNTFPSKCDFNLNGAKNSAVILKELYDEQSR